jgi:hypothetical protein
MAREPPHLPPEPVCVAKVQRCGLRGAPFAHFDCPKGSFPRKEHAFSPWWPFWGYRAVHNPTVVIPFSHSVDGVSSPVRDQGGLTRVPLRTHPSVLPRSVCFEKGGRMDTLARLARSPNGIYPHWHASRDQDPTAMAREPPH